MSLFFASGWCLITPPAAPHTSSVDLTATTSLPHAVPFDG